MKRKLHLTALAIIGIVPLAGIAADTTSSQPGASSSTSRSSAADTSGSMQPSAMFKRLDKDKDGTISKSEAKASKDLTARFEQVDTDRDGKITVSEWQAANMDAGAAGVTGESREKGSSGMGTSTPGSSGATDAPGMGSPTR